MANSTRIGRINDDIQLALSSLLRSVKDPAGAAGDDKRHPRRDDGRPALREGLALRPRRAEREGVQARAQELRAWLRRELGSSLSLRYTPELVFEIDHSIEYGAKISRMIEEIEEKDEQNADSE